MNGAPDPKRKLLGSSSRPSVRQQRVNAERSTSPPSPKTGEADRPGPQPTEDERGIPSGLEYDAWIKQREQADELCYYDWRVDHFDPLLGYEPHTQLILARSDGGARHCLDGRPVNAGSGLELLIASGQWLAVRYEWGLRS